MNQYKERRFWIAFCYLHQKMLIREILLVVEDCNRESAVVTDDMGPDLAEQAVQLHRAAIWETANLVK